MRTIIAVTILNLIAFQSFAATVKSAQLDATKENILVEVVYGGGCGDHKFSLNLKGCYESYPVQCEAELIHETNDYCEGLKHDTVVFNLKEYGLDESYYKGGSLKIKGDLDWNQKPSSATVRLP